MKYNVLQEYEVNRMKYNGLQLVHMGYKEACDFAGYYGMNAILVDLKDEKHSMFMCRLARTGDNENKLRISNNGFSSFNANIINEDDYDIYWIGLKNVEVD